MATKLPLAEKGLGDQMKKLNLGQQCAFTAMKAKVKYKKKE